MIEKNSGVNDIIIIIDWRWCRLRFGRNCNRNLRKTTNAMVAPTRVETHGYYQFRKGQ